MKKTIFAIITLLVLISLLPQSSSEQDAKIYLSKEEFLLGENVNIIIHATEYEQLRMKIQTKEQTFYQQQLTPETHFKPLNEGEYTIQLIGENGIHDETTFIVREIIESEVKLAITPERGSLITTNEELEISTIGAQSNTGLKLEINIPSGSLRYNGDMSETIRYRLSEEGNYWVVLRDTQGNIIDRAHYTTKNNVPEKPSKGQEKTPQEADQTPNSGNKNKPQDIIIGPNNRAVQSTKDYSSSKAIIKPKGGTVKSIKIIQQPQNGYIGLSRVPANIKVNNIPVIDGFAIDPQNATLNVTFIAKGTALHKCQQWNFADNTCEGTWEQILNTVPGEEYTIQIDKLDPGFAQTGLTTVNTNKDAYNTQETVTGYIVVLDNEGRIITGTNVTALITDPNGQTQLFTTPTDIIEDVRGTYNFSYNHTQEEGRYEITIYADNTQQTVNMTSYFFINNTRDFDITRTGSIVVDPFRNEQVTMNIEVKPLKNQSNYTFTETLSLDMTNISAPGATITTDGMLQYMTWEVTSNTGTSAFQYSANPPKKSPAIEQAGPARMEYSSTIYFEQRPWFYALDPELTDTGLTANITSGEQGETISVTGNLFCTNTGGPGVDFDLTLQDDTVDIDTTTSGVDFSCGGASSVSIDLCEAQTCTVNADCSVSVTNCGRNDDIDITWTLTLEGDNEALSSTNTLQMAAGTGTLDNTDTVTITAETTPPTVTLDSPANNFYNDSTPPANVTFTCSATDGVGLSTLQLYITNSANTSFGADQSCSISGTADSCTVSKLLNPGNYTWNCLGTDTSSNTAFASANRSLEINGTVLDTSPTVTLYNPQNASTDGDGSLFFQCNVTDNSDIVNVTLYTNQTGSWTSQDTTTLPGGSDTDITANFTVNGISDGASILWNCLAEDEDEELSFATNNYTVNVIYLPENPSVYLQTPANTSTENLEPITFTCSASDNNDIASINLFSNRTGSFVFEATQQFTGPSDSTANASFDISGFSDEQNIIWNCKAIDNNSNEVFASNNYTLSIDFLQPNVTLISPEDYSYDLDGEVNVTCNVQDNSDIANVSIYHNADGSWNLKETTTYAGGSDTDVNTTFEITGVAADSEFMWTCIAYDEDGFSTWASNNYTITIPPTGTPYFATDGASGGTWTNNNRVDLAPDGILATADLDQQLNLYTFNYNGVPTTGTLLEAQLSLRWAVSTTPTDDYLGMQYSIDNQTTYRNLAGTASAFTQPSSYPTTQTNQSYTISGPINLSVINSLYYRVTGFKTSGPDNVATAIDSIWLTARISPPPRYSSITKNASTIFQNDNVLFSTYWDDDIQLDCFIFSTNQSGAWTNSSCINLAGKSDNGTYTQQITSAAGTTVGWQFFARDSFADYNQTPVQVFIVADENDVIAPTITDESVTPNSNKALSTFTLNATITDNIGVASAIAEITRPTGTKQNNSMSNSASNTWEFNYTGLEGGNHTAIIYAIDGNGNINSSTTISFNVTPLITTDKPIYDRGETANIYGYGFRASQTVNIQVYDETNTIVSGFPKTTTSNSDGNITSTWTISPALNFPLGNHTVRGNDSTAQDNTTVLVVKKPTSASKTDDVSSGDNILSAVYDSDDTTSTLIGNTVETYYELRYQNNIQAGYTLDQLYLYVEHTDLDPESDTIDIQYYDGAIWQAATCGSLAFRATKTTDVCNLTADISSLSSNNDIRVRLSDGNGGNDAVNFAQVDIAYLDFEFSITNELAVTIEAPTNNQNTYEYTETTSNNAYDGPITTSPPATQQTGTEADTSEYTSLETSDNSRWESTVTTSGEYVTQSYYFTISEDEEDLTKLTITHEGYATEKTSLTADNYRVYLWDYDLNQYTLISADPISAAGSDQTTILEVTTNLQSYVDTNGEINILIIGDYQLGGCGSPANCRGDLFTDYIELEVETIQTITGQQDINVTAVDGDGVNSCDYFFSQGATTFTIYGLTNISTTLWTNTSDTSQYTDGVYNITANCTDGTQINDTEHVTVRVVNDAPGLLLVAPNNNTNYTISTVTFTWNATSDSGNPLCDLFIDGAENISDAISLNNQNTSRTINNIVNGDHTWSVRCNIGGGAYNTSETRSFSIDTAGPTITQNYPANNAFLSSTSITFNYTPSDISTIDNCSILIDGSVSQVNTTINNGQANYFSETIAEGNHNWSITCYDEYGLQGNSSTRNFVIDTTAPTVNLSYPEPGQVFLGGVVQFNYTASDNQDTSLVCNITIDGIVEDALIASPNNTAVIRNLAVGAGFKLWNVTCIDNAGLTTTSETRNFTVQGPPTVTLIDPTADEWLNYQSVNFTYYVEDGDGIQSCLFYLDGDLNETDSSPDNSANNYFNKTLQENHYNWTVSCTDNNNQTTTATTRDFTVDITPPTITLLAPANNSGVTSTDVEFNFTIVDNLDSTLVCDITVNDVVSAQNDDFAAANGSITTRTQTGIPGGDVYWNVTCTDEATNLNTSLTYYFFKGSIPEITLNAPDNFAQINTSVTFNYTPSDDFGLQNCSIYLNDQLNETDFNIENDQANIFTKSFSTEQRVEWYISCFNDDGVENSSETRYVDIDLTAPTVTLNYPDEDLIASTTVEFNFTATDNNASTLSCDIYLDEVLNQSVTANSGVPELVSISGISQGQHNWSATCTDEAGFSTSAGLNNFTISFGPSVSLQYPPDNFATSSSTLELNYTVSTTGTLDNCTLILDGSAYNTIDAADIAHIGDGNPNNFTTTLSEGAYNWTVQCADDSGLYSTIDEIRYFNIDQTPPLITLNYPLANQTLSLYNIYFNWTATDSVDTSLQCNLSVYQNGVLNKSVTDVISLNGTETIQNITGFVSEVYEWNVTCSDGVNTNSSATQNFTVSNIPTITLNSPEEEYSDADGLVIFSYTPETIAAAGWQFCSLIIDGEINQSDVVVENGFANSFNTTFTTSGFHEWEINCTDQDNINATAGPRNFTVDFENPLIIANDPLGDTTNSSVTFNWTATDNIATTLSCELYVNNTLNATSTSTNGTADTTTVNDYTDGTFFWNVTCYDYANRTNTSITQNFTVAEPPTPVLITPANETRSTNTTWNLTYTPYDNSGNIANCTLIINDLTNQTNNSIVYAEVNNFTIQGLSNGGYNWTVECTDPSGNTQRNESTRIFYVDLAAPNMNLTYPPEGETFNQETITFNWTATDFLGTDVTCDLLLDDIINVSGLTLGSPANFNATIVNITSGPHNWSVNCSDDLGNHNLSNTQTFIINQPDLALFNQNISFNNSNPEINTNITINANITNIGGISATNIRVAFYDGAPSTGENIGNDTITTIAPGATEPASISWNITSGYHEIWIIVDPENSIGELDETNNNATANISALIVTLNSPSNETYYNTSSVDINFNVTDFTQGEVNYTIFVDNAVETTGNTTDKQNTIETLSLTEGTRTIIIEGLDSLNRRRNSTEITVYIDLTAPTVTLDSPENNTYTNGQNVTLYYNVSDAFSIDACTIYVDGTLNETIAGATINNGGQNNHTLVNVEEGTHTWQIYCNDTVNNLGQSELWQFTVDRGNPTITPTHPANNANFSATIVELNYSVTDLYSPTLVCNITLDGTVVNTTTVNNNSIFRYNATSLSENSHSWNVTCIDLASNVNTSETRTFNTFIAPNVTLLSPENNTITNNQTMYFYYNTTDTTGIDECRLYFNGVLNQTIDGTNIINGGQNNFTQSFGTSEQLLWEIHCTDNSTQNVIGYSENRTLTIDLDPPQPVIETANATWFNTNNPSIDFNITDNFATIISYTFFVNQAANSSGTVINGTSSSTNINGLIDGTHLLELEGEDNATNKANSTIITIYIDTVAPNVTLLSPANNTNISATFTYLNYTVTDTLDSILECDTVLDGTVINSSNPVATAENASIYVSGLSSGIHYWNVSCVDEASNTGYSETFSFYIQAPDLIVNSIIFNETEPIEGQNITITTNISNIGQLTANNITVQFYRGNPSINGVQLESNFTIASLAINESTTISINYTPLLGNNEIFVLVDPPIATNGSIQEENESNNQLSNVTQVGHFHIVAGSTSDELQMDDSTLTSLFEWTVNNATGSNILIVDSDSSVDFTDLQALGRNTTNESAYEDFEEIDLALNSTNYTDSINNTWTTSNAPIEVSSFTVFSKQISDVPVVNSTNTSAFKTGILWDLSDGGTTYDGSQDIIFITEINKENVGLYGTYDYEAKIPASLRNYLAGTDTVSFYTEIQ